MIETMPKRFTVKFEITDDCWLWNAAKNDCGYGQYFDNGKLIYAHRFSWIHFNGDIKNGLQVLHRCDTPNCINPDHLFLGTPKDNSDDKCLKGRHRLAFGEKNGQSKLKRHQVDEIRKLYKPSKPGVTNPFSQRKLAKRYGVAPSVIHGIVNNQYWKSIG